MVSFLNGKYGLARTYWFGVVGFGFIARLAFRYINHLFLTAEDDETFRQVELLHYATVAVALVISCLLVRAMIKAGFDNRTPGGWGWIGIVLSFLSAGLLAFSALTLFLPSVATPRFMVEMEMRELNKQLPQEMGDGLVLRRVSVIGDDLVYDIRVDFELFEEDRLLLEDSVSVETPEGANLCEDMGTYLKGSIQSVKYKYAFSDETVEVALGREACLEYLESR